MQPHVRSLLCHKDITLNISNSRNTGNKRVLMVYRIYKTRPHLYTIKYNVKTLGLMQESLIQTDSIIGGTNELDLVVFMNFHMLKIVLFKFRVVQTCHVWKV